MNIADCIELFLENHEMPRERIDCAWTTQLENKQEEQLSAGGPGSGRHKEIDGYLQSKGFSYQGYYGEKKAGVPAHHYSANDNSEAAVRQDGSWTAKKGTWGARVSGNGLEGLKKVL